MRRGGIGWQSHRVASTATALFGLLLTSAVAHADNAVLEWNQIALAATMTANQGPVPQIRSMAIVHVAVHDAINGVTREYETYLAVGRKPTGASADAAAIAAAHSALVGLFPTQAEALNRARAASLAARGLSESDPGITFGEAVAAALLKVRSTDGAAQAQFPYTAPGAGMPGVWVAVGAAQPGTPGWGTVTPWVVREPSDFRPDGPPGLRSRRYARDYNEVKEMGALTSGTRTAEQTEIARFWLASPSVIWNGVARSMLDAHHVDQSSAARVLALLYLAAADASIVCWDAKYAFNFWRPITAIQRGDTDGNDDTIGDPAWTPLFTTPQHPEYVSGHSTNSGAMATILKLIFGDEPGVPIVAVSTTNAGFVRQWGSFSEGVEEVIDARIYSGFHYRTSDEVGARLGSTIARYVVRHELRPHKDPN